MAIANAMLITTMGQMIRGRSQDFGAMLEGRIARRSCLRTVERGQEDAGERLALLDDRYEEILAEWHRRRCVQPSKRIIREESEEQSFAKIVGDEHNRLA